MKKILLTLVGVICSLGMWADTETIYSMTNPTAPTTNLDAKTGSDLTATYVNGTGYVYNGKSSAAALLSSSKVNLGGSSSSYFMLTITTGTIQNGDVIDVIDGSSMSKDGGVFYMSTTTAKGSSQFNYPYTVVDGDGFANSNVLYFFKGQSSAFKTVTITRTPVSTETPSITTDLSSEYSAIVGKKTTLSIVASDATGYQWYSCDDASKTNAAAISGATSASYDYTPSAAGDAYFYCEVTNTNAPAGSQTATSTVAKVTASAPTNVAVTWSNEGGWSMRSVTTSTDTNTKLASGAEVETGTSLIFTTDTGAGWDLTWYVNGVKQDQTTSPLTLTINAATEVKSVYVARKKFTFSDNAKAKAYAAADGKITLSANNFSYEAGKTVDYWTNGEDKYYVGKEYTLTEDVELTPHFVDNVVALGDAAATVTWGFGYKADNTGCPVFTSLQGSENSTNYVAQATVLGQSIDANLVCDATNGKIDNERRIEAGNSQANTGSKFTIPVINGSVVTIVGSNEFKASGKTASTINGSTDYTVTSKTTATYTYSGDAGTIEYVVGSDNTYVTSISVTYPDNSGRKYATWTANKTSGISTFETASKTSEVAGICNMTDMVTNLSVSTSKTANGNASPAIASASTKTDDKYVSLTFDVANGYTFTPSVIVLNMVAVSEAKTFEVELSDATNTVNPSAVVEAKSATAVPSDVYVLNTSDTKLSGTVTLKMWVYGGTNGFRVGSIKVAGTTEFSGSITLGQNGYSTFAPELACTVTGATAYKAVKNGTDNYTLVAVEGAIPAGAGVILKGTEGNSVTPTYSAETADAMTGNALVGVISSTTAFATGTNYVLSSKGTETAFVQMSSTKAVADMVGKAYLNVPSGEAKAVIYFEGETTGINNVNAEATNNAVRYNLAGQRVNANAKGIVIMNGKKYIK